LLEKEDCLDYRKALPIFIQTCLALEYAHTQGIIHRDLKPNNIMLIKDYKGDILVKVIDFSIAKFTKQRPNQKTITKPGQIFGTPLYMSPEQCQGKKTDHRCDIYSLGCVMYETLCGVPPLMGDSLLNTIYKHVNELPTPFSKHLKETNIPKEFEAIVFKSLAKQPENRYQSARELRSSLELIQNQFNGKQNNIAVANASSNNTAKKIIGNIFLFCLACIAIVFCLFLNARMQ
jgi:serine/threonine-protein kinase